LANRLINEDDVTAVAARGTVITLVGNIIAVVIGAVGVLVTAQVLTPSEYGQYTVAVLPVAILSLLSGWGVDQALPRFLVRSRTLRRTQEIPHLVYTGLALKAITGLILAATQFVFADTIAQLLNRPEISPFIQISALAVMMQPIYTTITTIFAGLDRMTRRALVSLLYTSVRACVTPLLVFLGLGVAGAITGFVASHYIAVAVGVSATLIAVSPPPIRKLMAVFRSQASEMIRFGFPLFVGAFISRVLTLTRTAILPWFVSNTVIGNYQVATQFTSLITVFTGALAVTLYPSFSRLSYQSAPVRTRQAYNFAARYSALVVIPLTMLLIVVAEPMITTLYATRYPLAAQYFVLMMTQMLFMGAGFVVAPAFLTSQGDTRGASLISLLESISSFTLAPLGLHLGGVMGFILARTVAFGVGMIYLGWRLHQRFQVTLEYGYLVKLLGCTLGAMLLAIGTGLVAEGLPASLLLIIRTGVFGAVFIVILPVTRTLTRKDLENLKDFSDNLSFVGTLIRMLVRVEERLMKVI
jgi:O-antigen/teichoic acid export membrane protein